MKKYIYILYVLHIYKTNKGINNQLRRRWSITDGDRYSGKKIYIYHKGQRIPRSLNNKTYLTRIEQ